MMIQQISEEETEIMRQAYMYLAHHCNPPPNQHPEAVEWWTQATREIAEIDSAWNGHKLMREVLIALATYIEDKARQATEDANDVQEF